MGKFTIKKEKNNNWVIALVGISPFIISIISAIHIYYWFFIADTSPMSGVLSGAFEMLVIVSLLALAILKNLPKKVSRQLWIAIYLLLFLQILGNVFFYFTHIKQEFLIQVADLFGMQATMGTRRLLSILLGSILPLTAFFFTKFLASLINRGQKNATDL